MRNTTGSTTGGSIKAGRRGKIGRESRDSNESDVGRRGRYHFANQLVIASPSRAERIKDADGSLDGGRVNHGSRSADGCEVDLRSRAPNVHDEPPRGPPDDASSNKVVLLQGSGFRAPTTVVETRRPSKVEDRMSSFSMEKSTPALDAGRQGIRDDRAAQKAREDVSVVAASATSVQQVSTNACEASLLRSQGSARPRTTLETKTVEGRSQAEVQRELQGFKLDEGESDSSCEDRDGSSARFLDNASSSSSFSTVVIGEDPIR